MPRPASQPPRQPLIVGIVGGIGSGKSAVARWVAAHHPEVRIFDADAAGHEALRRDDVCASLRAAFGEGIFAPDGTVNRSALAARVFGDSTEAIAARRTLESIVHPAIRAAREVEIERLRQSGDASTLLVDAALLLEADWAGECDQIVYIDTPEPLRRQRVAERGWSAAEFARREASQWPLDRKKAAADHVIPNDRTLDIAGRELYEYIQQTLHPRT